MLTELECLFVPSLNRKSEDLEEKTWTMPSEICLSVQEMLTGQRNCQLEMSRTAMFSLCMVESEADEVNLHGVTSLGLKQALDFAYTGKVPLFTIQLLSFCSLHSVYFNPIDQDNVHIAGIANWSELNPMPVGRSHHCVAIMGNFLFAAGGEVEHASGRTCAVRTACRYDPRSNTWTEISSMKNCRERFVLGAVGDFLYAVGGRNELRQVLPSVERHCPKKNKWTSNKWISRSPMLQRRVYHAMVAVQRKLYVLGGNDLDYNYDRILVRHIDSYNMDTDQWTHCNFNLLTGQNESGVAMYNGRIYLVGGYSIWRNEPLACIQVYRFWTSAEKAKRRCSMDQHYHLLPMV
ncbi:hypothetical protein XELAEV_18029344mg [Xenopus laevis]|uniref:Kelch-like protein 32 n=1 Tax=Xenopus laevis TaxID=8355 RepID=A0A974CTQ9_XENLA|nr:hypothetical protein XELAEV_18029344mg [Xenopus laevis]